MTSIFYVEDKCIKVDLSQVDNEELVAEYTDSPALVMEVTKRVYHRKLDQFAQEMCDAIKVSPELLEVFLALNLMIKEGEYANTEEEQRRLITDIYSIVGEDETLLAYIMELVEENYTIDIEATEKGTEAPKQSVLQFTNVYAKRIISCGVLARITFPILCSFYNYHQMKNDGNLFMDAMNEIFNIFNFDDDGNELDLATKIQKFVQVQVDNTMYSDRVIWNYLKNMSVSNFTLARDICRDLMTNITPKLEHNRSIVAFFHVVIKHKIEYQFTAKFKVAYKPVKQLSGDDEISPFIKIEQQLISSSPELNLVMMKADIANFIRKRRVLSEEERVYHINNIVIHTAQTRIIGFFLNKQLGRGIPVLSLKKEDYVDVLFIAKKWFEENGYKFISFVLLGKPMPRTSTKKSIGRGKTLLEITESKVYQSLEKRFAKVGSKVNSETIIGYVAEIINTDFEFYRMPDGSFYEIENTPQIKSVIVELLTFIESL